jgi:Tropinone reductase 1
VIANTASPKRWSLAGATALVTGGSKGIGHAIVEELAAFGVRVHTFRNAAELEECRWRWAEVKGIQVTVSVCDVAVRTEREALMDTVKDVFAGQLDILVSKPTGCQGIVHELNELRSYSSSPLHATRR